MKFCNFCRNRLETVSPALGNVTIVQADALNTGEKGAFDLVHERLVLINVSAREAFLKEMPPQRSRSS